MILQGTSERIQLIRWVFYSLFAVLMPAHVRTDNTLKGYLFIAFLALILRMKLMKLMVDTGLSKRFSIEGLLTELEKIKVLILPDGQKITTEVTKKQREILDALNTCA